MKKFMISAVLVAFTMCAAFGAKYTVNTSGVVKN